MTILGEELYYMIAHNMTIISCVLKARGDKSSESLSSAMMSNYAEFAKNEEKEGKHEDK